MSDKELSDLSFNRKECPKCGAVWLNGNHVWRTGNKGNEETLHNLVCSRTNDPQCINKKYKKGLIYEKVDSWEKRSEFIGNWNPNE
jgi:Zn-finger nucleic acid-binding protein